MWHPVPYFVGKYPDKIFQGFAAGRRQLYDSIKVRFDL